MAPPPSMRVVRVMMDDRSLAESACIWSKDVTWIDEWGNCHDLVVLRQVISGPGIGLHANVTQDDLYRDQSPYARSDRSCYAALHPCRALMLCHHWNILHVSAWLPDSNRIKPYLLAKLSFGLCVL
jgi:hypothetical protein